MQLDLAAILEICKAYHNLGDAVADQIQHAADDSMDDANPNALRIIQRDFLRVIVRAAPGSDAGEEAALMSEAIDDYLAKGL